jgi:hypothetical protein
MGKFNMRTGSPAAWPVVLLSVAATSRQDGGVGLQHLLKNAGFAKQPAMTIVVKRQKSVDPAVADVLDALRAFTR